MSQFIVTEGTIQVCRNYEDAWSTYRWGCKKNMTVLVYLTSASLECYSQSKDAIIKTKLARNRSSCLEVFWKENILKNLAKLTNNHLCRSLFFKKVARLRIAVLLKRRFSTAVFFVNFANFLRASILQSIFYGWLLLYRVN